MIHDLVADLIIVLDVDAAVLEYAILHLNVVQETVFGIKSIEQRIFIDDRFSLAWYISIVLCSGACLCQADDALTRFY